MLPISIFEALADTTRCRIVELLRGGPMSVHVLASNFAISRPAISRHLRVLKQARLISEKKIGRENLYRLHAKRLEPAQAWLALVAVQSKPPGLKSLNDTRPTSKIAAKPQSPQIGFDF